MAKNLPPNRGFSRSRY